MDLANFRWDVLGKVEAGRVCEHDWVFCLSCLISAYSADVLRRFVASIRMMQFEDSDSNNYKYNRTTINIMINDRC